MPAGGWPCGDTVVPAGQEGLHVFDVGKPKRPDVEAFIPLPCGSHTLTTAGVSNGNLIVYSNNSSSAGCVDGTRPNDDPVRPGVRPMRRTLRRALPRPLGGAILRNTPGVFRNMAPASGPGPGARIPPGQPPNTRLVVWRRDRGLWRRARQLVIPPAPLVMEIFGDVGKLGEEGERAHHAVRGFMIERPEQRLQAGAFTGIAVAPEA